MKIPAKRIKSHPPDMTLEDLIDQEVYIDALNRVRHKQGLKPIALTGGTRFPVVAAAIEAMGSSRSRFAKTDVAAELLEAPQNLKLSIEGTRHLRKLHRELMKHFEGS